MTAALQSALDQLPDGSEIHFSPGIYRLHARMGQVFSCFFSNSEPEPEHRASILLQGRKNLVLNGHGAVLLCHGQVLPIAMMDCENIVLKDFSIDWDIPLTGEGIITAVTETYADVHIDPEKFPFHIQNHTLFFEGWDWSQKLCLWGHTEFESCSDRVAYRRGEQFSSQIQELLPNGDVRFFGDFSGRFPPKPGNILVLRHGDRIHPGLLIHHCRNIIVAHLRMYGNGGLGILSQFSDTLTFSHVYLGPNREAGRYFAGGHDDGIHLSAVSGQILIEHCHFLGLMDDPVNLHGIAVKVDLQLDPHRFQGRFLHPQSKGHSLWAEPGQAIAFLNGSTMEELLTATVREFHLIDPDTFEIAFQEEVHPDCSDLSLENLSRTAALTCRHNHFGACRARGLLCCSPQKILIEDNLFESAGAAIRIAGDVCTWYESGRCRDVTIRNNVFSDTCLTSVYQGGQGIISISPELPCPSPDHPCHRNITVTKNTFCTSDSRILYAFCTERLYFGKNKILKSDRYPQNIVTDSPVTAEFCKDVLIEDNQVILS